MRISVPIATLALAAVLGGSPRQLAAQACGHCETVYYCAGGGHTSHCEWYEVDPNVFLCLATVSGCEIGGGDAEAAATEDLRVIPTDDGPQVITRVSENYFGLWRTCDRTVVALWRETARGLHAVNPADVGLDRLPDSAGVSAQRKP